MADRLGLKTKGRRVRYVTTAALDGELVEAGDQRALSRVVGRYGRLDLLLLEGHLETQGLAEGHDRGRVVPAGMPSQIRPLYLDGIQVHPRRASG